MQIAKIIPAIILVACSCFAKAQYQSTISVDSSITELITELRAQHIDTILIYKSYFVGAHPYIEEQIIQTVDGKPQVIINDKAYCESQPVCIIWKKQGKTYFIKKDLCYDYSRIEIDAGKLWMNFFSNIGAIKHEKAKWFEFIDADEKAYSSTVDHTGIQNLIAITGQDKIEVEFDSYQMSDRIESDNRIRVNLNYNYNQSLKSKKFIDELDALINSLNKNDFLKQTWR